jgi:ABC-type dipeptide/oligopeptide/nickel transport system ATPase component
MTAPTITLPDGTTPLLEVRDLTATFGRGPNAVDAVRGLDLSLARGETMTLLGESGSGKSVTVRSILRLYGKNAHIGGRIRIGSRDLLGCSESEMTSVRGRQIAFVPQDPTGALDPLRKVGSQIAEVLKRHRFATGRAALRVRTEELLARVGIHEPRRVARSYPHELSGGMRQRVVIAIAVSC